MNKKPPAKEPIYQQLNQNLRDLVRDGVYAVGDKFLTERSVCERYGVSRTTANKALSNLVSEGILEFKKGVGTFIKGMVLDYNLRGLVSFTEKMRQAGKVPRNDVLMFRKHPAHEAGKIIMEELSIGPDEELFYFERLRLADGIPYIIEKRYLISRFCPDLTAEKLSESLYVLLEEEYGLTLLGEREIIKAVNLKGEDAKLLNIPDGMAGFIMFVTGFHGNHTPLWSGQVLYRGDRYELHNEYSSKGVRLEMNDQEAY